VVTASKLYPGRPVVSANAASRSAGWGASMARPAGKQYVRCGS
jgi:hypothetical protein